MANHDETHEPHQPGARASPPAQDHGLRDTLTSSPGVPTKSGAPTSDPELKPLPFGLERNPPAQPPQSPPIRRPIPDAVLTTEMTQSSAGWEVDPLAPKGRDGLENLSAPASGPGPGTVIGSRYEILKPLGAGGMGTVYLARDRAFDDRRVAIKFVNAGSLPLERAMELMRAEVNRQDQARSAAILKVLDAGAWQPDGGIARPYFVMEYLEPCQNLDGQWFRELGLVDRVAICTAVVRGLEDLQRASIVHADFKPSNILLVHPDPDTTLKYAPKIIDFGLARLVHSLGGQLSDNRGGTNLYMDPDLFGDRAIRPDQLTDLYSLSLTFTQVLTGTPPRCRGDRPTRSSPPSAANPQIDATLDDILIRMAEADRSARYSSAAAVRRDLQRWLNSPWRRFWRWLTASAERRPVVCASSIALLVALFSFFILTPLFYQIFPVIAGVAHAAMPVPGTPSKLERVVVVMVDEDALVGAKAAGLTVSEWSGPGSRPLIGELARRLGTYQPRVLTIDFMFEAPSTHDADLALAEGLASVVDRDIPVIFGSKRWSPDAIRDHWLRNFGSGALASSTRKLIAGGVSIDDSVNGNPPTARLIVEARPGQPQVASIAAHAGAAALVGPGRSHQLSFDDTTNLLNITPIDRRAPSIAADIRRAISGVVDSPEPNDQPDFGLTQGGLAGTVPTPIPTEAAIHDRTIKASDVLAGNLTADQQAMLRDGNIIVASAADAVYTIGNRTVTGAYLQAALANDIIGLSLPRGLRFRESLVAALISGAAGVTLGGVVAVLLTRRLHRSMRGVLILGIIAAAVSVAWITSAAALRWFGIMVPPPMPALILATAAAVFFAARFQGLTVRRPANSTS